MLGWGNFITFRLRINIMAKDNYKNVGDLVNQELAGCDPDMEWPGNFEVLADRLGLMLALYTSRAQATVIIKQITKEAKRQAIKYHEYVINEIQYEMRVARMRWKPDELKEAMINQEWAARLLERFPLTMVDQFMEGLKASRIKRIRE